MNYVPIFPSELQAIALALLPALAIGEQWPAKQGFIVSVRTEQLSAPSRVYYQSDRLHSLIRSSTGDTKILAQCLGSRHWDGFVREECVRQLMLCDRPWVVPFVVQLLGEYVLEIVHAIASALPSVNRSTYGEFARENPELVAITGRRITSYWDCYYRRQYLNVREYPAFLALQHIAGMA